VTTTTDKYKVHSPEIMHEPAMSDDDDDGILHFTITTVVITLVIYHLRSGVVYYFSAICLSVCLCVCLSEDNF